MEMLVQEESKERTQKIYVDNLWHKGIIQNIIFDRGFGFIKEEDASNLFFHAKGMLDSDGFSALKIGDEVEYRKIESAKGQMAVELRLR